MHWKKKREKKINTRKEICQGSHDQEVVKLQWRSCPLPVIFYPLTSEYFKYHQIDSLYHVFITIYYYIILTLVLAIEFHRDYFTMTIYVLGKFHNVYIDVNIMMITHYLQCSQVASYFFMLLSFLPLPFTIHTSFECYYYCSPKHSYLICSISYFILQNYKLEEISIRIKRYTHDMPLLNINVLQIESFFFYFTLFNLYVLHINMKYLYISIYFVHKFKIMKHISFYKFDIY